MSKPFICKRCEMSDLKFSGNIVEAVDCVREVVELVRADQKPTKHVVDHALYALGQFHAAFRPDDSPVPLPIGADGETCDPDKCPDNCPDCCDKICELLPQVVDGKLVSEGFELQTMVAVFQLVRQIVNLLCEECNL